MRESGVYEIERDSLYLISTGTELYIMTIQRPHSEINYETELSAITARR